MIYKNKDFFDFSNGKLMLNITDKCNVLCTMCTTVREDNQSSLSKDDAFKISNFAKKSNFRFVEISGGEPLLLDYIYDLVDDLCGKGIPYVQLITNGTLLNRRGIERLKKYSNLHMVFSFHGLEDIHDKIVKKKGAFTRANENIRLMAEKGIKVSINSVIQKMNYHQLYDLYDFFVGLPYEWHGFTPVNLQLPIMAHEVQIPQREHEPFKKNIHRVKESAKKKGKKITISAELFNKTISAHNKKDQAPLLHPGFMCTVPRRLVIVYNSGSVLPCYHHQWKQYELNLNLKDYSSLDDLVYREEYKNMILKATAHFGCRGCDTLCYNWDPDFHRKTMNPSFSDKVFSQTLQHMAKIMRIDALSVYKGLEGIQKQKPEGPVYIWGTGKGGYRTYHTVKKMGICVDGFIDNSPEKWETTFSGLRVFSPEILKEKFTSKTPPFVIIGSIYVKEISGQLKKWGYQENIHFQINESLL